MTLILDMAFQHHKVNIWVTGHQQLELLPGVQLEEVHGDDGGQARADRRALGLELAQAEALLQAHVAPAVPKGHARPAPALHQLHLLADGIVSREVFLKVFGKHFLVHPFLVNFQQVVVALDEDLIDSTQVCPGQRLPHQLLPDNTGPVHLDGVLGADGDAAELADEPVHLQAAGAAPGDGRWHVLLTIHSRSRLAVRALGKQVGVLHFQLLDDHGEDLPVGAAGVDGTLPLKVHMPGALLLPEGLHLLVQRQEALTKDGLEEGLVGGRLVPFGHGGQAVHGDVRVPLGAHGLLERVAQPALLGRGQHVPPAGHQLRRQTLRVPRLCQVHQREHRGELEVEGLQDGEAEARGAGSPRRVLRRRRQRRHPPQPLVLVQLPLGDLELQGVGRQRVQVLGLEELGGQAHEVLVGHAVELPEEPVRPLHLLRGHGRGQLLPALLLPLGGVGPEAHAPGGAAGAGGRRAAAQAQPVQGRHHHREAGVAVVAAHRREHHLASQTRCVGRCALGLPVLEELDGVGIHINLAAQDVVLVPAGAVAGALLVVEVAAAAPPPALARGAQVGLPAVGGLTHPNKGLAA
mmetsp:Transcript_22158/g.41198  ORF Transcript_22158/g.41198 Transcript_22158/m.41198 type:complete len:577 (-) Transcript_22158:338-2068(-)